MNQKKLTPTQLQARHQMRHALANLEEAQRLLGQACGELAPIVGLCPEWERIGTLYDLVQCEAQIINLRLNGGFDLDSVNKSRFDAEMNKSLVDATD